MEEVSDAIDVDVRPSGLFALSAIEEDQPFWVRRAAVLLAVVQDYKSKFSNEVSNRAQGSEKKLASGLVSALQAVAAELDSDYDSLDDGEGDGTNWEQRVAVLCGAAPAVALAL